jgi:hypothetical protein
MDFYPWNSYSQCHSSWMWPIKMLLFPQILYQNIEAMSHVNTSLKMWDQTSVYSFSVYFHMTWKTASISQCTLSGSHVSSDWTDMYLYNLPVQPCSILSCEQLNLSTEMSPQRQYIFAEILAAQKKFHKGEKAVMISCATSGIWYTPSDTSLSSWLG